MKRLYPVFLLSLILLSGCKKEEKVTSSTIAVKDDIGVELTFDKAPRRIISLAPNVTEALYSIRADSLIVGVTDLCDYPQQVKTKKTVGNYLSPDFETILSLKPELVIMYITNSSVPAYKTLSDNGIKIYASNPKDISGIKKMISDFGIITGKKRNADSVNTVIDMTLADAHDKEKIENTFIVISVNPLMTTNKITYISQLAEITGYHNIFGDLTIEYPLVSQEDLLSKKPSVIIYPVDTTDQKRTDESRNELRSLMGSEFESTRLILIDDDIMFRPGPRIMDALRILRSKQSAN